MSYNPSAFGYQGPNQNQFIGSVGTTIATGVGTALVNRYLGGGGTSTATPFVSAEPTRAQLGADVQPKRRRRRRRRMLTCSDRADIAFLHGQLGGGSLGKAAISSLLSRCR